MKKSQLLIIDGKFMRDGIEEKPEFGNLEQIDLIQEANERVIELTEGVYIEPDYEEVITYEAGFDFKCICGQKISRSDTTEKETDLEILVGLKINCHKCKRNYVTSTEDDEYLMIKLTEPEVIENPNQSKLL